MGARVTAARAAKGASTGAKRRVRRRGSGGIFSVREGVWRVDVEVRRDPVTGKRRRLSRYVHGTRAEAEVALARLKVADHERRVATGGTRARSVRAALQGYLSAVESGVIELAPRTLVTSRSAANVMSLTQLPDGRSFGDVRLSRLCWQDIEHCYAGMRAAGRGADWIRRCATVLTAALELARKRGLLETNPAKDASRPRSRRSKPFSPAAADVRALIEVAQERDPELGDIVILLASTGMRKGELLALRWSDVDVDSQEVHVAASISDGGKGVGLVYSPTKRSDWRDVPLTYAATEALRRQLDRRTALLGQVPATNEYVFSSDVEGKNPMRAERLTDRWAAVRGTSPITLLHLRHFTATAMLDAGESYRTVADILGNSENTLRLHYDGRTDVGKRKAIAALEL